MNLFIYTGFKPAFVIIRNISSADNWRIIDNKRLGYNTNKCFYFPDNYAAETERYI